MKCEEARELITALVDNELPAAERPPLDSHLKECLRCQAALKQERSIKTEVRLAAASVTASAGLRQRIVLGLRPIAESGRSAQGRAGLGWLFRPALRPALAFALLVLLLLPALYLIRSGPPSIALSTLENHQRIVSGSLSYIREENPQRLQAQLTRAVEGRFGPMGYDLSMMGLQPVGGAVQEVAGRKIIVALYEGTAPALTCYTFFGTETDAPKGAILFADTEKKINFYTFSHQGVNGVMHRQGDLICILVSKMPLPELLTLARSKAQPS